MNSKDIEEINLTNDEIINAVEDSLKAQGEGKTSIAVSYTHLDVYKRQALDTG